MSLSTYARIAACVPYVRLNAHVPHRRAVLYEITLTADTGYHIGYLVDLAFPLCLSFSFSFDRALVQRLSALLSSHVFHF